MTGEDGTMAQITEIEEFVFPNVAKTDVLGVPIEEQVVPVVKKENSLEDNSEEEEIVPATSNSNPILEDILTDIEKQDEKGSSIDKPITNNSESLRQTLKNLYGEDLTIVQEVDGQDVEVPINELELDPETFAQIIRSRNEQDREEVLRGKVSIEGVSELTKKMIEIENHGGKVSQELLDYKQAYIDPLNQIDTETTEGQKSTLELYYQAKGVDADEAEILIDGFERTGILENKALQAKEQIQTAVNSQAEKEKQAVIAREVEQQEGLKTYRKDLREKLDSKFELKDSAKARLVDYVTKKDSKDKPTKITELIKQHLSNPEMAADLVFFLDNKEEYHKQITKEKVLDGKIKLASTIRVTKNGSQTTTKISNKSDDIITPILIK